MKKRKDECRRSNKGLIKSSDNALEAERSAWEDITEKIIPLLSKRAKNVFKQNMETAISNARKFTDASPHANYQTAKLKACKHILNLLNAN